MSDSKFKIFEGNYDHYSTEANPTTNAQMQEYIKNQNEILGDLVNSGLTWQNLTAYSLGNVIRLTNGLHAKVTTAGTSGLTEPTWVDGDITDGTVIWHVSKYVEANYSVSDEGKTAVVDSSGNLSLVSTATYIKRNTAYSIGDIVYSGQLTAGRYLKCTTAGTTAATEPTITGSTVTDGTAVFGVEEFGGGGGTYGVAPNPVMRRKKTVKDTTVELLWDDPNDSYTEGIALAVWEKTVIVKKQGSLPVGVTDGTTVVTVTARNQYSESPYVDNQSNGDQWYYRAFPYSEGGIISTSRLNDFQFWLCGVSINDDVADSSAKVTPISGCDNYYMGKPAMNRATDTFDYAGWKSIDRVPYAPKPCMLKSNGTVDYYLDPNDHTKKEDGTASDVANSSYDGNAMVEWPKIWLKVVSNGALCNVYICSEQLDSSYVQWAYSNIGGYQNKKYLPMFEGSIINSKMRSLATGSVPTANTTMANEMAYAKANGTGWTITRYATEMLMQAVAVVFFCDTNGQNKLGVANPSTNTALTWACGNLKTKGALYGAASGYGGNNKFFYMEHWWGHRWRRYAGMTTNSNRKVYVKLTYGSKDDGSTTTDFITSNTMADYTSAYYDTGVVMASSNNPSWIQAVSKGARTFGLPVVSGGSATTYFCDCHWQGAAPCSPIVSGSVSNGLYSGVFALACDSVPSVAGWSYGASLEF